MRIFAAWLTAVTFVFATIPEPASKLSIYMATERILELGTQNEVAKALMQGYPTRI